MSSSPQRRISKKSVVSVKDVAAPNKDDTPIFHINMRKSKMKNNGSISKKSDLGKTSYGDSFKNQLMKENKSLKVK